MPKCERCGITLDVKEDVKECGICKAEDKARAMEHGADKMLEAFHNLRKFLEGGQ